jgi:Xaa-Pro aminopeptidase
MTHPFAGRQNSLRRAAAAANTDAFLTLHQPNLFYLSGFTGSSGALLLMAKSAVFLTDGRYTQQARREVKSARVIITQDSLTKALAAVLARRKSLRLAVESNRLTLSQWSGLQKDCGEHVRWIPLEGLVERLRAVKDPGEIKLLRRAAQLGSEVLRRSLPLIVPGITENELAAEMEHRMRRMGAQGPAFETIVAFGERTALPHARPTARRLRKNELVLLDLGVILANYRCDLTRTIFVGRASARIRNIYAAVLRAHGAACQAVKAGRSAAEVDSKARQALREAKLETYFTHSTGHGLGLEVHEMPRLARNQADILQAGHVVTIEPGAYIPGVGGVRIEDDVLVTRSGCELLTTASREFLEL